MYETIDSRLRSNFYNNPDVEDMLADLEKQVLANKLSSFVAAGNILDFYYKKNK